MDVDVQTEFPPTCDLSLRVINHQENFVGEALHISGSFNNWPSEHEFLGHIPPVGQSLERKLTQIPIGHLQLKLSRGSWDTVAVSETGYIENVFEGEVPTASVVELHIHRWRDQFPKSTASPQVHILDPYFFFPELGRYKKVWIYLPKAYYQSKQSYPVLYMHDGQHLFDQATAKGRSGPVEWQVDETIDASDRPCIVVAIDHAETWDERKKEYSVYSELDDPSLGRDYLYDIWHTLKPFVDSNYRTKKGRSHTAMVGSSLGAMITWYSGLTYSHLLAHVGVFSPSLWLHPSPFLADLQHHLTRSRDTFRESDWFFYMGGEEFRRNPDGSFWHMQSAFEPVKAMLKHHFIGRTKVHTEPGAKHGPQYWQNAFRLFYQHLNHSSFFN